MKFPGPPHDSERLATLRERLLAAARARPADERVPAGFVRRVQREIAASTHRNVMDAWMRGFWRALIPALGCLAVVLCLQPKDSAGLTHDMDADADAAEISLWETLESTAGESEL